MTWALTLPAGELALASALRTQPLDVCAEGGAVWLRGHELPDALRAALHALPALQRYDVATDGTLVPWGRSVPVGKLPGGPWVRLAEAIALNAPAAHRPGPVPEAIAVRLRRSSVEREANFLQTDAAAFLRWAVQAPRLRLDTLTFALGDSGVLLRGRPLPPLRGTAYTEYDGLAVPCGYTLAPIVDSSVLREALKLEDGELALFHPDGSYAVLTPLDFVPASRANARESLAARKGAHI